MGETTGLEFSDPNGNRFPEIFTLIHCSNNPQSFGRQVAAFHRANRARGLENVHASAYWKRRLIPGQHRNTNRIADIRRHLSLHPELPRLQNDHDMVFVWNIGDITMMTRDHIEELKILRPDIDSSKLYNLRESICEGVNGLEDSIDIIRKVDNIEDALLGETNEMRRAAPIYDALRELYNSIQSNDVNGKKPSISHDLLEKLGILDQEKELCQIIKKHQKVYHQRWKYAKRCIELINRRSAKSKTKKFANIVISEEGVASAAAQLMLAGLSSSIPFENIYSTYTKPGEVAKPFSEYGFSRSFKRSSPVIKRIRSRFGGENCGLVYIASGWTMVAHRILGYWIEENESIKVLHDVLQETL